MMNKNLINQLAQLGLNDKQATVYFSLIKHGSQTPLQLSRLTNLNRTTIYRLLNELNKLGLTQKQLTSRGFRAQAIDPQQLQSLLQTKQVQLDSLQQQLPSLINQLTQLHSQPTSLPHTQIIYYQGREGLRQLLWNTLKAKNGLVGYGYANWDTSVGHDFAEQLRTEIVARQIPSREIQNPSSTHFHTRVSDYHRWFTLRYLPKSQLTINHDTYIYNDTLAFAYFYQNEIFGLEIHNSEIAQTQRQIFNLLWSQASATPILRGQSPADSSFLLQ